MVFKNTVVLVNAMNYYVQQLCTNKKDAVIKKGLIKKQKKEEAIHWFARRPCTNKPLLTSNFTIDLTI